jgi:tight adherence protein C
VLVMSLVWLFARVLLRPRSTLMAVPASGKGNVLLAGDPSDDRTGDFVASLAAQFPQTLFGSEELEKDFRRAGYYRASQRSRYFALRNGLGIMILMAAGAAAVAVGPPHYRAFWIMAAGVLVAVVGFSLARVFLAITAKHRVERIRAALPDAMDTIGMCLHGGISLQECLGYVGEELMYVHPDLALELLIVGRQAEINSFEFAIQQFAGRIDAPEVIGLASLVTQNQRLGVSIVDSVREFADSLRLKRRQLAEARASRAELFLLFPVVFCLVPSILLLLWGPPILSLIEFVQGQVVPTSIMP